MYTDILILSSVIERPLHGYEIKRGVGRVLGREFALNNNQLYPALRRLEEMGAVEKEVVRQEGRPDRHVYRATGLGREVLGEMLREFPPELARNDAEFMVRVALFELLEPEERRSILRARREFLEEHLERSVEMDPRVGDGRSPYAAKVVSFHRSTIEHELAWISELEREVEGA